MEAIIHACNVNHIPQIVDIAYKTWFVTYENVISKEQIDFMFGEMYTPEAIWKQMDFLGHRFFVFELEGIAIGFASVSEMIHEERKTAKVHKLYFLPEMHGKGYGKQLLKHLEELLVSESYEYLILNVNRNNPAYHFYTNVNYCIRETIDIPYGEFMLNDYVMEKKLKQ